MDAARLLRLLRPRMGAVGARWMVGGGFAVVAYGSTRTTHDLDLVVDESVRARLLPAIQEDGFRVLSNAEGFTNLLHEDPELGRLDLIWVEGETSRKLFEAAGERMGPDGAPISIPAPEHLLAMKIKAVRDRPTRILRDGDDLQLLLRLPEMDQNEARGYFERNGLLDLWHYLKKEG